DVTILIRDRKIEALTEFPNANPPINSPPRSSHDWDHPSAQISKQQPITPKDRNRLSMLRQDPSVASLLDTYDNNGRLDSTSLSNTPSAAEKECLVVLSPNAVARPFASCSVTRKRGTSPAPRKVISRIRRFADCPVPTSSFHLETLQDTVSNGPFHENKPEISLSDSPHTVDVNTPPVISSMEVELSYTSDDNPASAPKHTTESELRPAAEVFGFLLEKRRPRSMSMNREFPSIAPPSARPGTSNAPLNSKQSPSDSNNLRPGEVPAVTDTPSTVGSILMDPPHTAILERTRTPVVHGRLHEGSRTGQATATAVATGESRIPHDRRSLQIPSGSQKPTCEAHLSPKSPIEPVKRTLASTSSDDALHLAINAGGRQSGVPPKRDVPLPPRNMYRRSVSYGSRGVIPESKDAGLEVMGMAHVKGLKSNAGNMWNITNTAEDAGIMYSPGNPKFRLLMTPSHERALRLSYPSPASSSELSPVGQRMMAELRKQRQTRSERKKDRFAEAAIMQV
ncbi:hypothetical protein BC827DRAFT_1174318, partial [Russula dissimulans]